MNICIISTFYLLKNNAAVKKTLYRSVGVNVMFSFLLSVYLEVESLVW